MTDQDTIVPVWTLGERLRKARETANLTAEAMAIDIGRTERTIRNYESDATRAPLLVIRQYAMRCAVPLDWLIGAELPDNLPNTGGYPLRLQRRADVA